MPRESLSNERSYNEDSNTSETLKQARLADLRSALSKSEERESLPHRAAISPDFLRSIKSNDELSWIEEYVKDNNIELDSDTLELIRIRRNVFGKWPNPDDAVRRSVDSPLIGMLDSRDKILSFLEFVDFCKADVRSAARVINQILAERDKPKNDGLVILQYPDNTTAGRVAGRLAAYSEEQPRNARMYFLVGLKSYGYDDGKSWFSWR